ncbi:ATP-grasp domain-containing protein [Variovorax sp. J22R133]|uniref:ATP-grasp domain-containing protein n=1 Tax=Variovorax brevis TaxID=3053503 RepID=UPI002576D623|nr:ATP-grasp domain-containing protein [Variovorax sp. J22R133]MDM0110733.1 ATP-grasp domain-containing protein [Variovorax sp. J22R133]
MTNILLSCAGRRHYLAEYFRAALAGRGRLIGADMDLSASALTACDAQYEMPPVFSPDYIPALKEVIRKENVRAVFPLNDLELFALAKSRSEIEDETGAFLYVPSEQALEICSDKWQTRAFLTKIGLPSIPTFLTVFDALQAIADGHVCYPLIVKPRWGSGSIGLFRVYDEEDLLNAFVACEVAIKKSILSAIGSENTVVIQEIVQGPEYGLDILYGNDAELIGFAAKRKLAMRAGETDKAVTVAPDAFVESVRKIHASMPHRGNLDCDFLEKDGELYLLEFNPRFGGGYPFTHLAGANHIEILISSLEGRSHRPYKYAIGSAYAKCDTLVNVSI